MKNKARCALQILLVEDKAGAIRLIGETPGGIDSLHQLHVMRDGDSAVTHRMDQDPYERLSHPGIVLLDLNSPRKDGRQLLEEIKGDDRLREIPIIALATPRAVKGVGALYKLRASGHAPKPMNSDDLWQIVRDIGTFWRTLVSLPETV